jgi:hypothetical protein
MTKTIKTVGPIIALIALPHYCPIINMSGRQTDTMSCKKREVLGYVDGFSYFSHGLTQF